MKYKKSKKHKSIIREWIEAIVVSVFVATIIRWLAVEHYAVPSSSMEGTVLTGDHLLVSKLHYGARTPITPLQIPLTHKTIGSKKSYSKWLKLPSYRLPAFYKIQRGDVVVFNFPMETDLPVDMREYYIKRCVALPGDVVMIKDSELFVNDRPAELYPELQFRFYLKCKEVFATNFFKNYDIYDATRVSDGYMVFASAESVKALKKNSFIKEIIRIVSPRGYTDYRIHELFGEFGWNADFFGPYLVPKKGSVIRINSKTLAHYRDLITNHESNRDVRVEGARLFIDGKEVMEYTFRQDYYFVMGDNRHNSIDSRYWGCVPYDHIVGKAILVIFSRDLYEADFLKSVRLSRTFSVL